MISRTRVAAFYVKLLETRKVAGGQSIYYAAGDPAFELGELEGLNHRVQTAEAGAPNEYRKIEETLSPRALDVIGNWILERFGDG